MRFGTMKYMGHPSHEEPELFIAQGYKYKYHVYNDWNPCILENLDTGKELFVILNYMITTAKVKLYEYIIIYKIYITLNL